MAAYDTSEWETLRRAREGDAAGLDDLFTRYRRRLTEMVRLRLSPRVQGRVDPSDIVQEAYLEIAAKLDEYLQAPTLPFYLWLRLVTGQKLALAHRRHLGVKARAAGREISLTGGRVPEASSAALAARLVGKASSPSQAVLRAERRRQVQEALQQMDPIDREVLTLRHFEQLTNAETALALGIKEPAACNRYVRALERLRGILTTMPGGTGDAQ